MESQTYIYHLDWLCINSPGVPFFHLFRENLLRGIIHIPNLLRYLKNSHRNMQESHPNISHCFYSAQMHFVNSLEQLSGGNSFKVTTYKYCENHKGTNTAHKTEVQYHLFFCEQSFTQDFLGNPFLLYLPITEFLPASCAPCWRG